MLKSHRVTMGALLLSRNSVKSFFGDRWDRCRTGVGLAILSQSLLPRFCNARLTQTDGALINCQPPTPDTPAQHGHLDETALHFTDRSALSPSCHSLRFQSSRPEAWARGGAETWRRGGRKFVDDTVKTLLERCAAEVDE